MTLLHDIATALGDTSGVLERAVEQASIADLDFELPCGSEYHDLGLSPDIGTAKGSPHGGPASHFLHSPCGCVDELRCQTFMANWFDRPFSSVVCRTCGLVSKKSTFRVIPIGNP